MQVDHTTLEDLSLIRADSMGALTDKLNLARTSVGKAMLEKNLRTPLPSVTAIIGMQQTIAAVARVTNAWPDRITNGTIMVVEKFFETAIDPIPAKSSVLNSFFYKLLHGPDHSLALYSAGHCLDLIAGIIEIRKLLETEENPMPLKECLHEIDEVLAKKKMQPLQHQAAGNSKEEQLTVASIIRHQCKYEIEVLLELYAKLDSWYGMAMAMKAYELNFPEFTNSEGPLFRAEALFHPLLEKPVSADIELSPEKNFMFLTGANMSGKSTFIKSIGIAAFLAHTGMGVPAKTLTLTYFDGLISNINITDDITRGESYFFNEVKRIKSTVNRVAGGGHWLVLMDELFKGTNTQDAMKCSHAIVEGLSQSKRSVFILSTHLFEIAEELKSHANIQFYFFQTDIAADKFVFYYRLKPGVSSDRIGYRILEQQGVTEMLRKIK